MSDVLDATGLPDPGDVVRVEGMPGRFRVRTAEPGKVVLVRAGRVEILYGADVALITTE